MDVFFDELSKHLPNGVSKRSDRAIARCACNLTELATLTKI